MPDPSHQDRAGISFIATLAQIILFVQVSAFFLIIEA